MFEDNYFEYCYISNGQVDEGNRAYAHIRADGSVMDYKRFRIIKGSILDGKLRSLSGQQPTHDNQTPAEISAATANGSLWYTTSWADRNLVDMLLRLMSCNDNSQVAFGNGNLNYNANGSPIYGVLRTVTMNSTGQFFGYNDNTHTVKAFHLERWWGDQRERSAGMVYGTAGKIKVKMTPAYNTDGAGYTETGITISGTSSGYTSKTRMIANGRISYEASGSETTYTNDGIGIT